MNKPQEIVQAWINRFTGDEAIHQLAAERRAICDICPHKNTMLNIEVCGVCHCPLEGKTHSPVNSCPKDMWVK